MTHNFDIPPTLESNSEVVLPLIQKFYSLHQIANDPWSEESRLYIQSKDLILSENGAGAESLASIIFLNALNLKFEIEYAKNVSEMSPSGRSPLLKCGRFSIGEFDSIVNFCSLKGHQLNKVDQKQANEREKQALIKSYLLLINKQYSDLITFLLWKDSDNQKMIEAAFTVTYPWPLGKLLYFKEKMFSKNKMIAKGIWNHDLEKMFEGFCQTNDALNKKLNDNLYLVGKKLSEADILLYSYIRILKKYPQFKQALDKIEQFPNILDFFANMDTKFCQLNI